MPDTWCEDFKKFIDTEMVRCGGVIYITKVSGMFAGGKELANKSETGFSKRNPVFLLIVRRYNHPMDLNSKPAYFLRSEIFDAYHCALWLQSTAVR